MLEVARGQQVERLVHLEAVLALPVPTLRAELLGLLQPVLDRPPVTRRYVKPAAVGRRVSSRSAAKGMDRIVNSVQSGCAAGAV